jgi:hypothetical protein
MNDEGIITAVAEKLETPCKQEVFDGLSHEQLDLK